MTVANIAGAVNASLVERDGEVNAILLGLIAREHVLFVGPPGGAKSLVCRNVCKAIDGARYVERLLSPTTDPDEVWGPIDPVEYRTTGRYVRRTDGYAATAHLLFLDEFFRGSDAIRDTLLHLLGPERQTLVDGQQVQADLITAVGASNAWADSSGQSAIMDRWLIRCVIKPVSRNGRDTLMFGALAPVVPVTTIQEVLDAALIAEQLPVSVDARAAFGQIMDSLADEGIRVSDRRARASVKVARAAAFLAGNAEVQITDLECLVNVLWDVPDQREKAADVILKISNPAGARLNELLLEVDQIVSNSGTETASRMEALKKIQSSMKEVTKLVQDRVPRADKVAEYIKLESQRLSALAFGMDPAQVEQLMSMNSQKMV